MQRLRGALKDYPWGRTNGLTPWTAPTGGPQAELWFGAHPSGPSPLVDEPGAVFTADVDEAPVLVKLLAAGQPLSVQVHPTAAIAREQWEKQQAGGPLVYADPHEKAEVLYALEPFRTFAGWRADPAPLFAAIPGTESVQQALATDDRRAAVQAILELTDIPAKIAALPAAVCDLDPTSRQAYADVVSRYPDDVGALVTLLLDAVTLQPGEAMFVAAGVPHSYLDGLGIEVMTTSDNVARLGLTTKPVFADHAVAALRPDVAPKLLAGEHIDTPAGFDLAVLHATSRALPTGRYRLVLALEPGVSVTVGTGPAVELDEGMAAAVAADEPDCVVQATGRAACVTARST